MFCCLSTKRKKEKDERNANAPFSQLDWTYCTGYGMTLLALEIDGSSPHPCRCQPPELLGKPGQVKSRIFPQAAATEILVSTSLFLPLYHHHHDSRPLHSLMLRTSLRSVRGLSNRPVAAAHGRQWQAAAAVARPAGLAARVSLSSWFWSCELLSYPPPPKVQAWTGPILTIELPLPPEILCR